MDPHDIIQNLFNYDTRDPYQNHALDEEFIRRGCSICGVPAVDGHDSSLKHRFNFHLFGWKKYRNKLIKNKNGMEITVTPATIGNIKFIQKPSSGSHIIQATPQESELLNHKFTFLFKIKNTGQNENILLSVNLLYPFDSFIIDDYLNKMNNEKVLQLNQGANYFFRVHFEVPDACIGQFKMPIILSFLNKKQDFDIMQQVVVNVGDGELDMTQLSKIKRLKANFENVKTIVAPIDVLRSTGFQIPPQFRSALALGLNENRSNDLNELKMIRQIKEKMKQNYPNRSNYGNFFHFVLWMEEIGEEVMMSQYNMGKVTLIPVKGEKVFELEVEGLAEKRPSLLKNDIVNIKEHQSNDIVYQGKIIRIFEKRIHIGSLNVEFYNMLMADPTMKLDISFQPSRITYERMHLGTEFVTQKPYLMDSLFPEKSNSSVKKHSNFKIKNDQDVFNKEIINNPEQKQAVENILNSTSGNYPYIVFGPPGTGKTITIVEAILQIKKHVVRCNILVCAPANAACNMLTSKLIPWCKKSELIRVHSSSNPWDGVPKDVQEYSNWKKNSYYSMHGDQLKTYRIVITTLAMSGRYLHKSDFTPQYVFIDEAAQAAEPEAVIAIALLAKKFQLVLAGDPKQLGPIIVSKAAKNYYLGVSLLERLMSNVVYRDNNPDFITMLRLNFRAHPQVLHLPNKLFYNNHLEAISSKALNDPIASICIYSKINNLSTKNCNKKCSAAIEFYGVNSKEKREQRSPSYFNLDEVNMVVKTVETLCKLRETTVSQDDIGVITPYISQVFKIKMKLKALNFSNVEVGSTETFQGREKRIIIISTVRAQKSLLLYDAKYKLGFVKNQQRFNVALTRAMSKLIVIGCPNVLRFDKEFWLEYMEYCIRCNSYFGAPLDKRTKETMDKVVFQFNKIT